MANLTLAYILWFFLGIFGVHHFYLRRDRQAFVWWATFGGVFGLGWIRDLWRLADYVEECNIEEKQSTVSNESSHFPKVKKSLARLGGMMAMGLNLGSLVQIACPTEWYERKDVFGGVCRVVIPYLAVALGVHLVANIGHLKASKWMPGIGVFAAYLILGPTSDPSFLTLPILFSSFATYFWGLSQKPRTRRRSGFCKRFSILCFFGTIYLLLWGSSIYFKATITTNDGESVPLRVALNNFFNSPAWTQTKETLSRLWEHIKIKGWKHAFEEFVAVLDPEGETHAYKVLGLDSSATQEDIKIQYKKLAKEWHPDKQKDPSKKKEAETKFMEIQAAYETLSTIKARRTKKSKESERTEL